MTRLDTEYGDVLERLRETLQASSIVWALTGSTSFALQGVPVDPNDIDIQTTEAGAYAVEALFSTQVVEPVSLRTGEAIRSHFGTLSFGGVSVEIMGALRKRRENGTWDSPVDIESTREYVPFRGDRVPVLPLEYEARAYERLGRTARAAMLRNHIE